MGRFASACWVILVSVSIAAGKAQDSGPFMADGIKIAEVRQDSAIVWTRLTRHRERNIHGFAWTPKDDAVPQGRTLNDMEGSVPGAAGEVRVVYWPRKSEKDRRTTSWQAVDPGRDFTQQVKLGDLAAGTHYQTFRWGKDLQIWLVEGRDFRTPNDQPDGPEKTIWGQKQKQWFFQTVKESDATFRILISPTPLVGPDRENKNDNHANKGFAHEGTELRKFIGNQRNMYVVCGDRHWQYVSSDPSTGVREYACGPSSDLHAEGYSESMRTPMHHYLRIKGGFLMILVERENDKPSITFRHCGTDGSICHEDKLTTD